MPTPRCLFFFFAFLALILSLYIFKVGKSRGYEKSVKVVFWGFFSWYEDIMPSRCLFLFFLLPRSQSLILPLYLFKVGKSRGYEKCVKVVIFCVFFLVRGYYATSLSYFFPRSHSLTPSLYPFKVGRSRENEGKVLK